ncbi:MAG: hypothetical protein B7X32_20695, partial [Microbacterium sp. 13-71-7]
IARGAQLAGSAVAGAAGSAARGVGVVGRKAADVVRRKPAPISAPEGPGPELHPSPPGEQL